MSNEISLTDDHSWILESTFDTDPIADENTAIYNFGKHTKVYEYPVTTAVYTPFYYNSLDPGEFIVSDKAVAGSIVFTPVNGVWDYMALCGIGGSGVSHTTGVFTLTPSTDPSVKLNSLTGRSHWGNSTTDVREHWTGNKINSLIAGINFALPNAELDEAIAIIGKQRADPYTPAATHTPVFPSSQSNTYRLDSQTVFTVDGTSYINKGLMNFTYRVDNFLRPFPVGGQNFLDEILRGNRFISFSYDIKRAQDFDLLWTTYKNSLAGTPHAMQFDIYNGSGTYRKKTFNNCYINIKPNRTFKDQKIPSMYSVSGSATSLSPINKDGLATSFYGV